MLRQRNVPYTKAMKKIIFVIFAHPDDEAFGPSGTLLIEKAAGHEVHLICATAGESGVNVDGHKDLASVRLDEWRRAGQLIGANSMHHLGYHDGHLKNNDFHPIAAAIEDIIAETIQGKDEGFQIELMSGDLNGISGHLDHILMSRVACYVFCRLKSKDPRTTRLRLICIPVEYMPESNCDWLYMDAGRRPDEINEVIDARQYKDKVFEIMRVHHSQRSDGEGHIERRGEAVAINHFIVIQ